MERIEMGNKEKVETISWASQIKLTVVVHGDIDD